MEWSNGRRRARAITDSIHDLAAATPATLGVCVVRFTCVCVAPARPKRGLPIVSRFGAGPADFLGCLSLAKRLILLVPAKGFEPLTP
jgi:hypothetical protein